MREEGGVEDKGGLKSHTKEKVRGRSKKRGLLLIIFLFGAIDAI